MGKLASNFPLLGDARGSFAFHWHFRSLSLQPRSKDSKMLAVFALNALDI